MGTELLHLVLISCTRLRLERVNYKTNDNSRAQTCKLGQRIVHKLSVLDVSIRTRTITHQCRRVNNDYALSHSNRSWTCQLEDLEDGVALVYNLWVKWVLHVCTGKKHWSFMIFGYLKTFILSPPTLVHVSLYTSYSGLTSYLPVYWITLCSNLLHEMLLKYVCCFKMS